MIDYALGAAFLFAAVLLICLNQLVWALLPAIAANVVLWSLLKKVR